jgi:hypothetical protein
MRIHQAVRWVMSALCVVAIPVSGNAQSLGTFRWQLQPFCNVLTLNVTQVGGVYRLDGVDDLCGGSTSAAAVGIGFSKPDGTIGFGVTVVIPGSAAPLHITSSITLSTVSGTWQDSGGNSGAFVFNPAIAPGSPRPPARTVFVAGLSANNSRVTSVATPTAGTDAANRDYVDQTVAANAVTLWLNISANATVRSTSPPLAGTTVTRAPGFPAGYYCINFPASVSVQTEVAMGSVQQAFGGAGENTTMTVTRTFGSGCNPVGFDIAVQTFNGAGALADRPFMLFVPR